MRACRRVYTRSPGGEQKIVERQEIARHEANDKASAILPGMARALRIAIVGAGNLGTALALALPSAGFVIDSLIVRPRARSPQRARALARKLRSRVLTDARQANADLFWLCVPDSQIAQAARSMARQRNWKSSVVLHTSGALGSVELKPLRVQGAKVASAHPLMTFVRGAHPPFAGIPFAVEGDVSAVRLARQIIHRLGGKAYPIRRSDKAAYHAWGTFASPLLTALLATTEQVAGLAGVRAEQARPRMVPIVLQTLANYASLGAPKAFSGPIVRGDVETVGKHLHAFRSNPVIRNVYAALALAAVQFLPARHKADLKRVIERALRGQVAASRS